MLAAWVRPLCDGASPKAVVGTQCVCERGTGGPRGSLAGVSGKVEGWEQLAIDMDTVTCSVPGHQVDVLGLDAGCPAKLQGGVCQTAVLLRTGSGFRFPRQHRPAKE